jgi:hypothetical protein
MMDLYLLMSLKTDDVYFLLAKVHNEEFFVVHHRERVDGVIIAVLPQSVTRRIEVQDGFLSARSIDSKAEVGGVASSGEAQYLLNFGF